MARRKNDTLKRNVSTRKYRDVCWVSAEGKTEKDYLSMEAFRGVGVSVKFPKDTHPSRRNPAAVLKRFQKVLRENDFRKGDDAWLVIDVDEWSEDELAVLLEWEGKDRRHHLAISNPKFELFLVMHFEKGNGCTTANEVDSRLKRYMPEYDKRLKPTQFSLEEIERAVENARLKRTSCDSAIPDAGMSDVYKLVDRLLSSGNEPFKAGSKSAF